MLNSFKHVNEAGEETFTNKTYSEDSEYVELKGELGVILHDFVVHLTLMGYSKEEIAFTMRQELEELSKKD